MRKSYVTIEDMGTERQNAGYAAPVFVPRGQEAFGGDSHKYGRTSISEIERVHAPQAAPQAAPRPRDGRAHAEAIRCTDVSEHVRNCMVCSRLYHQDLVMYYMIIGVLAIVVVMLLLRR